MSALSVLNAWQDKIPSENVFMLQQQLEVIDESSAYQLMSIPLKEPLIGLLLGFFLGIFGIDRFYKGDIGIGILKLLLCWATFGIWWLLDLFLVYRGIKRDNFQKIMQNLAFVKKVK